MQNEFRGQTMIKMTFRLKIGLVKTQPIFKRNIILIIIWPTNLFCI